MSHTPRTLLLVLIAISVCAVAFGAEGPYSPGPGKYPRFESKQAEPGISYGQTPDLTLPKTLLYSVDADELLADAETWAKSGFNGFFLTGVANDWSSDVWAADKEPWTLGESDKTFQTVRHANGRCRLLGCDVFLTTSFSHTFEWFNDSAWRKIDENFRQFAIFARDTGCTGLAIDIEYVGEQYHFAWPGYAYQNFSHKELVDKVRKRMTRIVSILYDEFPDMTLLTLPEGSLTLAGVIQGAWIEEAARRGAPGGVHICTEYTYRRPNIRYMLGHTWLYNSLYREFLSARGQKYWAKRCSISAGLWPFGSDPNEYHGEEPSLDEFRQAYAASLMMSRSYNWVYSHNLRSFMKGTDLQGYANEDKRAAFMRVMADRQIAVNPEYVKAAQDLRAMTLRDYSRDLGLSIVPTFVGPREEVEVSLMPSAVYTSRPIAKLKAGLWTLGARLAHGADIDLAKELSTQTHWLLLGPFDNKDRQGYATAYAPESELNLQGEYDGLAGKVRWSEYHPAPKQASVDLVRAMQPSEYACAYALCFANNPVAREVQIRGGANDAWKLWVAGKLAYENPGDGRIILDRDIVPVTLPAGTTPVLLKVCNNRKDWGFIFRITDAQGTPIRDLTFQLHP